MRPKDADRMANSVSPDQTAAVLGLQCLPRPVRKLRIIAVPEKLCLRTTMAFDALTFDGVEGVVEKLESQDFHN